MVRKDNFYFEFQEKQVVPDYISKLSLNHNGNVIYHAAYDERAKLSYAYNLGLFPSYLNFETHFPDEFGRRTIMDKKDYGCAVSLQNHGNINAYVDSHFKKKGNFRNKIRKNIRRLEGCFDIRYEMFFGDIEKSNYGFLMECLHSMIVNRFSQIDDTNFAIAKWERIYNQCFDWICTKKASLFVIFDNDVPVTISLNYHFDKVFFGAVSSYDTDYSKFALGHIMIFKVLDWCFENDYELLDMSHGNLQYKQMWCNLIYSYESHILYRRNKLSGFLMSRILLAQVTAVNFLKAIRHRMILRKNTIKKARLLKASDSKLLGPKYKPVQILDLDMESLGNEISIKDEQYKHLVRSVNDFLYLNELSINDIKLFKKENKPFKYYIQAKSATETRIFSIQGAC